MIGGSLKEPFEHGAAGFAPGSLFFDIHPLLLSKALMRIAILILFLALESCSGNQPANNAAIANDSGTADFTAANDTTAIDAATGEDADMAADVNYLANDSANDSGNVSTNSTNTAATP